MFKMPFMPDVELAQQGLDQGSLRFISQCSALLIMALLAPAGPCRVLASTCSHSAADS